MGMTNGQYKGCVRYDHYDIMKRQAAYLTTPRFGSIEFCEIEYISYTNSNYTCSYNVRRITLATGECDEQSNKPENELWCGNMMPATTSIKTIESAPNRMGENKTDVFYKTIYPTQRNVWRYVTNSL